MTCREILEQYANVQEFKKIDDIRLVNMVGQLLSGKGDEGQE